MNSIQEQMGKFLSMSDNEWPLESRELEDIFQILHTMTIHLQYIFQMSSVQEDILPVESPPKFQI